MRPLGNAIRIHTRFARSTNLERDGDTLALSDYVPTARSLDLLRRFVLACADSDRSRAWSISGPYGSGKSSFALLLDGLEGGASSVARQTATELIQSVDPEVVDLLLSAHRRMGTDERGMIRAVITADPEPVTASLLRALDRGVRRFWPRGRKPAVAHAVVEAQRSIDSGLSPSPIEIVDLLRGLSEHAPVLLLIDEFGKNLEYLRQAVPDGELYALQAIAEAASGSRGLPVFLMTMQHMSFDDYSATASTLQRREWAKIQGRFEDVLYLDSPEQTIKLIGRVFEPTGSDVSISRRILDAARKGVAPARMIGLSDLIGDEATLARTYPLHPSVVAVLPELCRRYGQNERTLFGFLSHDEPHAVGEFLQTRSASARGPLPVVRLADVFDYFVGSVSPALGVSPESARWFEIHDRISQAIGLGEADADALKTIGVLNLVAQGGALRASRSMLAYALGRSDAAPDPTAVTTLLRSLEKRGFITYRSFADEYRLWQGSDVDLDERIAAARKNHESSTLGELISHRLTLQSVVASRYSQERGTVRTFGRLVADDLRDGLSAISAADGSDGWIIYLLQGTMALEGRRGVHEAPVIVIEAPQLSSLREPLLEAIAAADVLTSSPDLDWVARRELEERAGQATASVQAALESRLRTVDAACLLGPDQPEPLPPARSVSELASIACDRRYNLAPVIRNEMLARGNLTSQAARARIELLSAMVEAPALPNLGIGGFGPEHAMYQSILARTGIHAATADGWVFGPPTNGDGYQAAWKRLGELLSGAVDKRLSVAAIEDEMRRPPLGVKSPILPILLTAYLLAHPDEVAVYQDGVFQPRLAPDLLERLTKASDRFELRYLATEGTRMAALRALAAEFGFVLRSSKRQRGAPLLSVVTPLLERVSRLPEYSLRSARLSKEAQAVREAILTAREPDQLLYEDLPSALGFKPIRPRGRDGGQRFASALHDAVREIERAFPSLLGRIAETVSTEIALYSRNALKVEAAARARPLLGHVVEPRLRSLLTIMSSDTVEDPEWLEAVGLAISERPPQAWKSSDEDRFAANAAFLLGSFRRVEALYFDGRAQSPSGFIPRRITITVPDGTEFSRVVWVDEADLRFVRDQLEAARRAIGEALPQFGDEALLATLAEQILESGSVATQQEETVNELRGLAHGS